MRNLLLPIKGTDFEQLAELGRGVIPTVAPEWTDHNAHDPGIMLLELMAWIADAQVYGLSRTRRDERRAYARLLGVEPRGPVAARGLIWPIDPADAGAGAAAAWEPGTVVIRNTAVTSDRPHVPTFYTTHDVQLTAAQLTGVRTRFADGSTRDWTAANSSGGATFLPFGDVSIAGDRLELQLDGELVRDGDVDVIAIGVEIVNPDKTSPTDEGDPPAARCRPDRLLVSLRDSTGERAIDLLEDTTLGLLTSGVLLLRVREHADESGRFTISIRSAGGGLLRPPRFQRIAPNVLPVAQVQVVSDEKDPFGTGMPDQWHRLNKPGLLFPFAAGSFTVRTYEDGEWHGWDETGDLQACGPADRRFVLDPAEGILFFGNGINGQVPSARAPIQVTYAVSDGAGGNLPGGIRWSVRGVGPFGTNSAPMSGGSNSRTLDDLRTLARRRAHQARPIVTASDLEAAALALGDLDVTRTLEPTGTPRRVRGARTLIALAARETDTSPPNESPEWLEAIRARLAPRLAIGQRLDVVAPRYVSVRITARLVAARNVDPESVRQKAERMLRTRFAVVPKRRGDAVWPFGRDVTSTAIAGWLRGVEGVARVLEVHLFDGPTERPVVPLQSMALPEFVLDAGDIGVERTPLEAAR